jgi:phosphopantothenoylcysteine synthetase/decarboxylase
MRVLLGITESPAVAAVPRLAEGIVNAGHELQIVSSICPSDSLLMIPFLKNYRHSKDCDFSHMYLGNEDDAKVLVSHGRDIYHHDFLAELGRKVCTVDFYNNILDWPEVYVIAPLSIEALAEIANGLTGNLVTAMARYHDLDKPFIVAPAMEKRLWNNPITQEHLAKLSQIYRKLERVDPSYLTGDKTEKNNPAAWMTPVAIILQHINSIAAKGGSKNRRG